MLMAIVACGPSAEEKAAMEKARQDSIAAAQKAVEDSIAAVNAAAAEKAKQDSTNMANMEKARQDSAEAAAKKLSKPKPKTNEQKKKEDMNILRKQKG